MSNIRALHVHDAANVGRNLVEVANLRGQHWSRTPIPWYYQRQWTGILEHPVKRSRGPIWDAFLAVRSLQADVVHIHTGGLSPHARWLRQPWVLHLHGTDVRTRQYEAGWREKLQFGADHANAVVYSTPELEPHVRNLTSNGTYLPVPVRTDLLPSWEPIPGRVIFPSRWEAVKGGDAQIEVATRLREARPDIELLGLDWGDQADQARQAGVELVSRKSESEFRSWLGSASVAVGQMTDILSISELEALAVGVPLVSSAKGSYYPRLHRLSDPEPAAVAAAVLAALEDPQHASSQQRGREFVAENHDAGVVVEALLKLYDGILRQTGRARGI